jgi:Transglutaminase-like superfamily
MSKLYHTEQGNVVPILCEELTSYRRAKKILHLPRTGAAGQLFVLARAYPQTAGLLHVTANGVELAPIQPSDSGIYQWYEVNVPSLALQEGRNEFELWADSFAMNAWSLGLESGHASPDSFLSTDSGANWRNEAMGYLHVSRGEYIVRTRLAEGKDPEPPPLVWEAPHHPRMVRMRSLLPKTAFGPRSSLERVRALTTWVATQWEYRNTSNGIPYGPWDPETILAWGERGRGHYNLSPVVMCVHYGVVLAMSCIAVGIPARCAAFTGGINDFNGHFTAEVWIEELGKWIMVDPTVDAIMFRDGTPLSVGEIQDAHEPLAALVQFGPGNSFQMENPLIKPWMQDNFLEGVCFRHRSLWPRVDFFTHPELTPSGHGSTSYCETNLVWETSDLQGGFDMFPLFGSNEYFEQPPVDFPHADLRRPLAAVESTGR